MLIAMLDGWVEIEIPYLVENEKRETQLRRVSRHIQGIIEYCNSAVNKECKINCEALGLGTGHSKRRWAGYRGKERGRDGGIADID